MCWLWCEKEWDFPTKMDRSLSIVNQWIVLGEPVVSKDQRAGRIKWSDIEV